MRPGNFYRARELTARFFPKPPARTTT